jgi:two-component system OmpR family response regulator
MTAPAPAPHPRLRVLLAEDDARLADAFARRLRAEDLTVDVVVSVAAAREHERRSAYDCLVLDRLLPDGDIVELVRELDARPCHPPIVLVSAVADEEDRVAGLQAGADDYVAKPLHLDELAVRVTRLVEATLTPDGVIREQLELGEVRLDPLRLRVRVGDETLVLPRSQVLLLRTLMLRPGRAVGTDELVAACAAVGEDAVTAGSLPVHVDALGRALEGHLVIEQAPRHSYVVRIGHGPVTVDRRRRLIRLAPRRLRPS